MDAVKSPAPYKNLALPDSGLVLELERDEQGYGLQPSYFRLALFVMREADCAGHFSDNVVQLHPAESVELRFTRDITAAESDSPLGVLQSVNFTVRDLYSSCSDRTSLEVQI